MRFCQASTPSTGSRPPRRANTLRIKDTIRGPILPDTSTVSLTYLEQRDSSHTTVTTTTTHVPTLSTSFCALTSVPASFLHTSALHNMSQRAERATCLIPPQECTSQYIAMSRASARARACRCMPVTIHRSTASSTRVPEAWCGPTIAVTGTR